MLHYSVDTNHEIKESKNKIFRLSFLFAVILTIVLAADTLLVILTKEQYLWAMVVAIVITVLFSWFAICFFTIIYKDVNNKYRFFKGLDSGVKPTEEVEFIKSEEKIAYVNGLYVYPVKVIYIDGINRVEKVIYTFKKTLNYREGDKLTITTYQRILLEAEKHS